MNEELEKIAQDMRRKERELWAGNPPRMGNGAVALMLDGYASRLEVALGLAPRPKCEAAATEREMAKGLSKKLDGNRAIPGNAAAMRAALLAIDGNTDLLDIAENLAPNLHPSHSFVATQIRKIVRAALSAPAMNCDRFTNAESAIAAFRVETGIGEKPLALWLGHDIEEFAAWFFALATERRGGSDGE